MDVSRLSANDLREIAPFQRIVRTYENDPCPGSDRPGSHIDLPAGSDQAIS